MEKPHFNPNPVEKDEMDEHEEGAPVSDVLRILTVFAGHEML